MRQELLVQCPTHAVPKTLRAIVSDIIARDSWDRITVAVAYATVAGVRNLLDSLAELPAVPECRWLLGLDDCLTQPGALRLCMSLPRSTVRVASFADANARFHPKLICLSSSTDPLHAILVLGSANLTISGLTRNGETTAIVSADSRQDALTLEEFTDRVWRMGLGLTAARLRKYERDYRNCHHTIGGASVRHRPTSSAGEVLAHDQADLDPSLATVCWIEVGKNTALGRELEFKAEQALFFGLSPKGGKAQMRSFHLSDGNVIDLRLKYQENAMWRLQMNNDVPEVAVGLRPRVSGRLGRSPYAAVFVRRQGPGEFSLRFVLVTSREYQTICRRSRQLGTVGRTSSRQYGWY